MRESKVSVTFLPQGKTAEVLQGTRLVEAAARAGISLDLPCGGEGTCGKCRVRVLRGDSEPTPRQRERLSEEELRGGYRLACQMLVEGPLEIEVPETSLLAAGHQILARSRNTTRAFTKPVVRKQYVEMPMPERGSDQPDLTRLRERLGPVETDLEGLRLLPGLLRLADFRGTAVVAEGCLLDFEPGDTTARTFGVAFDIGTTTLVAELLDLGDGSSLGLASRLNPQTAFGDDVLSRILHARDHPGGLGALQEALVEALDEMIGEMAGEANINRDEIYAVTFSGNTTMQELLLRVDPRWLGEVPFVPATGGSVSVQAARLGLRIHPRGRAYVMPVIGGFVGGDTVSGILSTEMAGAEGPTLLVDIGTNGEIVLAREGKLAAASTAAGPAFEGARISHGMRGSTGAIEKVAVNARLETHVIGNVPPVGLCGSALIDVGAELLRHGILTPQGRLLAGDELPQDLPADLRDRVVANNGAVAFLLAGETETGTGRPVVVTQRDFRELQLATGAIRAGIAILLSREGLKPADLHSVLIAGGFGNFIRRGNAQRIGLLPSGIPRGRIRYQGNTSLAGARLVALCTQARRTAEDLARRSEHLDLSFDPGFQMAFAEAMIFPEE